jgi:hypothetical protein
VDPVLGRVVVERQQFVLIAGDLRDGLGELGAVGGLELPDRGAGVGSARLSLTWEIEQLADELTGILGHHATTSTSSPCAPCTPASRPLSSPKPGP